MGKSGEEGPRGKQEALRAILAQVPLILWTTDVELRFTDSMGAEHELLNQEPGDVRGTSLFAYFRTTDPEFEPIAAHRRALAGESVTYEATWKNRTFQSHVEPLRGADGAIGGVIGVAFDVTQRKRAEEDLRQSIALLKATIDATADAILVVDAGGAIVNFNRRFVDLWGISEEVVAKRDDSLAMVTHHVGLERLAGLETAAGDKHFAHRHLRRDLGFDFRRAAAHQAARQKRGDNRHDTGDAEHDDTLGVHETAPLGRANPSRNHLEFA